MFRLENVLEPRKNTVQYFILLNRYEEYGLTLNSKLPNYFWVARHR
jgi:hypothetical protein